MICIVEDDKEIREMESYALKSAGFDVFAASSSEEFFKGLVGKSAEAIVLDVMLPGSDGFSILKKLRESKETSAVPVMMVTARTAELDKIKGLDSGADDYLTKPFGIMEFLARVRALIRRSDMQKQKEDGEADFVTLGEISIDNLRHQVSVSGNLVELTFKEYELLKLLCSAPGFVFSREQLMEHVWGIDMSIESRTVDMHIKTLRKKLGVAGDIIKTVRNVGYKAALS
ncbi:MAG: response regulator transcription factor [Fibrobacteraceae bacterium]